MNHEISVDDAAAMTSAYRNNVERILDPQYQNKNTLALNETFDKSAIDTILGQTGCVSLRIYYGMDADSRVHAILVGVNEEGYDMLPDDHSTDSDKLAERSFRCKPDCPTRSSVLNS